ncbi:MAG TPA: cation:proton antiporter [Mariprofundaceae bacterium]|nr:cation:proton antiporter [Mariprofundaceae bacterium]
MNVDSVLFIMFLIFFGAAVVATLAMMARQAMLVSYIVLGIAMGPAMLGWVGDAQMIRQFSDIGILFLLFLLGLNLPPQKLAGLVRETTIVTVVSAVVLAGIGVLLSRGFGYTWFESLVIGAALMFSSTIIGIKLLPTTVLHHRHTGEIIISILLLQDLLAIFVLLLIRPAIGDGGIPWLDFVRPLVSFPALYLVAWVLERLVIIRLLRRFDTIQEYMFLLAIGWCLGMAELAHVLGLSLEIGAFVAGVVMANSPVAQFIAEQLKTLRDFFLIIFFFAVGAGFHPDSLDGVWLPAVLLAAIAVTLKPLLFAILMRREGEARPIATEVGIRLGQMSEFSILIAILAMDVHRIGPKAATLIQLATILTFVVSPYLTIMRYPTPVAVSDRLRRD